MAWSFPEARDFGEIDVGRFGKVVVRTEPYPEALLQSRGYTAFGAAYPDTVTLTQPGRQWDQLLLEYARGDRPRPAWGLGELGYHGPPKPLDEALTVFLVAERTPAGILDALQAGRLYAFHPLPAYHLVLEDFSLSQPGANTWVPMGGELTVDEPIPLQVTLRISTSDRREVPIVLRLIYSGRVLEVLQGQTPFERTLAVSSPEQGRREFFRLEVTSPHQLLSNPIFVRRAG